MRRFVIFVFLFVFFSKVNSQTKFNSKPTYLFGFQVKPLFPSTIFGQSRSSFSNNGFEVKIRQQIGYSFGASVRVSLSELIGIETGLNFFQRYFTTIMSLEDSNIVSSDNFGFIQYDLPINALFSVKLTKKWLMNAAIGTSICYKPSSVGKIIHPIGKHEFFNIGLVDINQKVNFDINGIFGFEYRTEKFGYFYFGGAARVQTSPLFHLLSRYRYGTKEIDNYGPVNGSFLAIELKYFIPNTGGNGQNFDRGPIE